MQRQKAASYTARSPADPTPESPHAIETTRQKLFVTDHALRTIVEAVPGGNITRNNTTQAAPKTTSPHAALASFAIPRNTGHQTYQ